MYILIDYSYLIHYKWFAAKKRQNILNGKGIAEDDDEANTISYEYFERSMQATIEKLCKKIEKEFQTKIEMIVYCLDSPRSTLWRTELYSEYKETRIKIKDENFNNIFKYATHDLLSNLLIYQPIKGRDIKNCMIKEFGTEGDDVIAIIKKEIRNVYSNTVSVFILTNDNDFVQLHDDNTYIYNLDFLKPMKKNITDDKKKEAILKYDIIKRLYNKIGIKNVEQYLRYKILNGDKSDNIPSIKIPGQQRGKDVSNILMLNDEDFMLLIKDKNVQKTYTLNKTLIDFSMIPKKYSQLIIKKFNDLRKNDFKEIKKRNC